MAQFLKLRHNNFIMPKHIPQDELDKIQNVVAGFPEGAGVEEISQALTIRISRRTLQRRLALLVEQKKIIVQGRARASRYRLPVLAEYGHAEQNYQKATGVDEVYVPLSNEGMAIREAIRKPIQARHPVGYNRSFLDSYRPNETFYLLPELRQRLYEMAGAPEYQNPAGTYARHIFNRLLIDLSWNSSRLEGNTYSLLETELLLEFGEAAEGKNALEAQMILNHKAAIKLLVEQAGEVGLNKFTILNLHALLADNLLADSQACGRLRAIPVGIAGTVYFPLEVPQLIDEYFRQILAIVSEIEDPFEQSFFVMVHLPYLQPFEDVNKRVSRLTANIPLIRSNLSPLSFVDVPDRAYIDATLAVYELNRIELLRDVFVWAYQRSCARYSAVRQSLGEPDPFRLKYRIQIRNFVAKVVQKCFDKRAAVGWIARKSVEEIPVDNRARFIEIIETELGALHEGNIARYNLSPKELKKWQRSWI
ncbi:MAG: Fic family protein [Desulfobulbaceae bacterium]|nr:Fic family protein [Desulfobulbaceae bacterium]